MARPRNEELYNAVKRAAYRQLLERGYAGTTYQSIASACGVARITVQNYFPAKVDLALAFFDDLLGALRGVVGQAGIHQDNEFDAMYCIGQGFFAFLLEGEGRRKLLFDLASSRELTSTILLFELRWGQDFIAAAPVVSEQQLRDDVIVAMGGFYELLYQRLKDGAPIDVPAQLGAVVEAIMRDYGYEREEAHAFVTARTMTEAERTGIIDGAAHLLGI